MFCEKNSIFKRNGGSPPDRASLKVPPPTLFVKDKSDLEVVDVAFDLEDAGTKDLKFFLAGTFKCQKPNLSVSTATSAT